MDRTDLTPDRMVGEPHELKPVEQPTPQPVVDRSPTKQRRMPSLPTTPWRDDGR
jgi:hypothetical protein